MTLIQSWIDSLALLKPKNAQLFVMVTIKSILDTYKLMLKYWWWAVVLMIVCYYVPIMFPMIHIYEPGDTVMGISRMTFNHFAGHIAVFLSFWLYELLFVAVCLSTRPSIAKKDAHYFGEQFKKSIIYWLLLPLVLWPSGTSPWAVFLVLFFIDSAGGPKNFFLSMWNALKMVVFNCPLLVVVFGLIVYLPVWLLRNIFYNGTTLQHLLLASLLPTAKIAVTDNLLGALLLPIFVCTYANIYVKKLHDQFDLYFKPVQ